MLTLKNFSLCRRKRGSSGQTDKALVSKARDQGSKIGQVAMLCSWAEQFSETISLKNARIFSSSVAGYVYINTHYS